MSRRSHFEAVHDNHDFQRAAAGTERELDTFWSHDCMKCRGTGAQLLRGLPDYNRKCDDCNGSGKKKR